MSEVDSSGPDAQAESQSTSPLPPPRPDRAWRFLPWVHPGALGALGLVLLGLLIDTLALPPGPLPTLILVADVPFLWLLWHRGGRRWKRWAFLYGFVHFAWSCRWIGFVHPAMVPALGLFLSPVYVILGAAIRWSVRRGLPYVFTVGVLVVFEEVLRTIWLGGMPWPARSLSFAPGAGVLASLGWFHLLPATAYVGAYGLSFLAGVTSAWVSGLPAWWRAPEAVRGEVRRRFLLAGLLPVFVFGVLLLLAGMRTWSYEGLRKGGQVYELPTMTLAVQATIPQALKHTSDGRIHNENFTRHLAMSGLGFRAAGDVPVETVLWPETMVPWEFLSPELANRFPDRWAIQTRVARRIRAVAAAEQGPLLSEDGSPREDGRTQATWLIGAIHLFRRDGETHPTRHHYGQHDSLFQIVPAYIPAEGVGPVPPPDPATPYAPWVRGRHDKVNRVPGGEYTPLGEYLPFLRWIRNINSVIPELDAGEPDQRPMILHQRSAVSRLTGQRLERTIEAGTVVCFDLAFPATCRSWRQRGARVLLNPANYGWFGPTGFRAQIRAVARLRAAEGAVSVVMAGNTGPSGFFDPLGRPYGSFVPAPPPAGEGDGAPGAVPPAEPAGGDETTYREGVALARLRIQEPTTLYCQVGDAPWFLLLAVLLLRGLLRGSGRTPPGGEASKRPATEAGSTPDVGLNGQGNG